MMDVSHSEGPLTIFVDDYRRMRSSNDSSIDKLVTLTSLGVVDLDTAILPDVFGLWVFDDQENSVTCSVCWFRMLLRHPRNFMTSSWRIWSAPRIPGPSSLCLVKLPGGVVHCVEGCNRMYLG